LTSRIREFENAGNRFLQSLSEIDFPAAMTASVGVPMDAARVLFARTGNRETQFSLSFASHR
jgi:hypothetical protein